MNGIQISRKHTGASIRTEDSEAIKNKISSDIEIINEGVSDFSLYFENILNKIPKYNWLIIGDIQFNFPKEWFKDEWYDKSLDIYRSEAIDNFLSDILIDCRQEKQFFIGKPNFLLKYCKYFIDDWCDIFSLKDIPSNINQYVESLSSSQSQDQILEGKIDICFSNVDAAYWNFFAKDKQLLTDVINYLQPHEKFKIKVLNRRQTGTGPTMDGDKLIKKSKN